MKHNIIKKSLLLASVVIFAGSIRAQSQAMPTPRLAAPMVIPAAPSPAPPPAAAAPQANRVAQPAQPAQLAQLAPAPSESRAPNASRNSATPSLALDNAFKEEMAQAARQSNATQAAAPDASVSNAAALRSEMVARMRLAVERIAAEYGNPTFAQVFTNDAVQAQAFRKRVQLLHRAEAINAEIAELEKQKVVAKGELDTVRQELAALQEQADALTNRLTRARTMLGMTSN
jgi:hypothetical protein